MKDVLSVKSHPRSLVKSTRQREEFSKRERGGSCSDVQRFPSAQETRGFGELPIPSLISLLHRGVDLGPMTAKRKRVQLLVLPCLLLLLRCHATPAQTRHDASSQIPGVGGPASPVEGVDEGLGDRPGEVTPPAFYRALSRHSMGRYVLATSSLVAECARVYAPSPFVVLASSLWSRFAMGLGARGRDRRGSLGQRKSSPFSYDRFMSPGSRKDEEDLDADPPNSPVPPDKYGRVSTAFLVRHALGDSALPNGGLGKSHDTGVANAVCGPVSADASPREGKTGVKVNRPRQSTPTAAGSVLKSLGSLGSGRRRQALDDMDLLSDLEDNDWNEWEGEGGGCRALGLEDPEVASVSVPKAKPNKGRNLVDADDSASTLIEKMRLGRKPQGGGRVRGRRKHHGRSQKSEK